MIPGIAKTVMLLVMLSGVTMLIACSELKNGENIMPATDQVTAAEWQAITHKRILFGHQSVGNNILSGVKTLADGAGVSLQIMESRNAPTDFGITHFKIGKNEDPQSKIKDFENTLASGDVQGADIALMKLCYIDMQGDTDAKKLAEEYISSLERLSQQFPKTVFIAVTSPIRTVQRGPKAWLKRLFGREPGGYADNFRRQEFNTILRNKYGLKRRLFDVAKFEAEGAGSHIYKGQPLESLNPDMTSDGGHLNANGEQFIAAKLLKLLAGIPARK